MVFKKTPSFCGMSAWKLQYDYFGKDLGYNNKKNNNNFGLVCYGEATKIG